jgi:hypothetical protein
VALVRGDRKSLPAGMQSLLLPWPFKFLGL